MDHYTFYLTLVVLAGMTAVLALELARTEVVVFAALLILLVGGVISPQEAFGGFSNHGMLAVAFLFVVAAALESTGLLQPISTFVMGRSKGSIPGKVARLTFPVAGASAFINNTPLVALLIPSVKSWGKRYGVSPSKLLIPLSYAAVLGGTITLVGTSTNLVVHGQLIEKGYPGFTFFELARVGIPITVAGLLLLSFVLSRFLPDRKGAYGELGEGMREFVIQMKVAPQYQGVGKSIEAAGLRHLQGLFLFQIERNGEVIAPVVPKEVLLVGDRLFFTGIPSTIVELQKSPGLDVMKDAVLDLKNYDSAEHKTFEVVISATSPLLAMSVRESNFRSRYNGVILAIHRSGERVKHKIGDVVLQVGDTLLILAPRSFYQQWYHSHDFYLISASDEVPSKPRAKAWLTIGIVGSMVAVVTMELAPMVVASAVAAVLLVGSKCISLQDARENVEWGTLLVIASAFGLAHAMENSGIAEALGKALLGMSSSGGALATVAAVYFATMIYTEFITNNAAAALLFPVAISISGQSGLPVMALIYAVTIGASCGFAIPYGYQTNLMVYGPGGYRFTDFLKVGIPMDVIVGVTAVTSIYLIFF